MSYDIGDVMRLSCTFSVGGSATDPTTVTLKVKTPAGVTTTYTYAASQIIRSAAGVFYRDVPITEAGWWRYRWEGTGGAAGAEEASFHIGEQMVT